MAEKPSKGPRGLKRTFYEVGDDKLKRTRESCPKCGAGVFLAIHANRASCGRCGYTEFGKKG